MIAGITGHRNLPSAATEWIEHALEREVRRRSILFGYTSLAIGADQIFARVLRSNHIPYGAVIPCRGYEDTFSNSERQLYTELSSAAKSVEVLEFPSPAERAFMAAGRRIVELSDVLFAVWDGRPSRGLGGTADVVDFAASRNIDVVHFNPVTLTVQEIRS